jgi:hypothetical protein
MLVDVLTDKGMMLAKVVSHTETTFSIRYFLKRRGDTFVYEDTVEEVDVESINDRYEDDEAEKSEGYELYLDGSDSEYEPSESDDEDSDSESLDEEDEDLE